MDWTFLRSLFHKAHPAVFFVRNVSWIPVFVLLIGQAPFGRSFPPISPQHTTGGAGKQAAHLASSVLCPVSLNFGDTIQCSISVLGETDSYTFAGNSGDRVYVRMSTASGNVWSYVRIRKPDGTALCGAVNVTNHATAGVYCDLPSSGTYTILAADYDGVGTGDYYLYLQRLNVPGTAVAISFGQTQPGMIAVPAQSGTYTFTGNTGDKIYTRLSASFWAYLHVFNPDGSALCSGFNALSRHTVKLDCSLPAMGTYTILVDDYEGLGSGDYHLYLQRVNNPGAAVAATFGMTLPGAIGLPAQSNTYTFGGNAGDRVLLRLMRPSGSIRAHLKVYAPDGTGLCEGYNSSSIDGLNLECSLPATGTYAALVDDADGSASGEYFFYLQRLNNPGNASSLPLGIVTTGTFLSPAQGDTYTFTGAVGDRFIASLVEASGSYYGPELRLYDPAGNRICNAHRSTLGECALSSAGSYTLIADEYDGTSTGKYYLYSQRLNDPVNTVPHAFGQALPGTLLTPAQNDTYTFSAEAGDKVFARMSLSTGEFRPWIGLYAPDGTKVCSANNESATEITSCSLPVTGRYSLLAGDYYDESVGSYYLYLQRLNNPGNALPILSGQTRSGSLLSSREIETYAFNTAAPDTVLVRMINTGPYGLQPEIRLYAPDGTLQCGTWGYSTAEITSCGLSAQGKYTILAGGHLSSYSSTVRTGAYSLFLQANNPGNTSSTFLPLVQR